MPVAPRPNFERVPLDLQEQLLPWQKTVVWIFSAALIVGFGLAGGYAIPVFLKNVAEAYGMDEMVGHAGRFSMAAGGLTAAATSWVTNELKNKVLGSKPF